MADIIRAVAYARFSSDGQREESIEAQVRAIKEYAERNGYALHKIYADRGISGTTDNRPDFQHMIDDAKKGLFDVVIVHKLDRFARNRADSAIYRQELNRHNVRLVSVLENLDDSPESILMESMIEGMNEYYSKNLRREVMKGLRENALTCRFTGGIPCLGYDIDKNTLKYIINTYEAEAVKLIFKMYLEGEGYTAIINELNIRGFKTKKGSSFGKNSLYEILRNEKYSGVYVYNRCVAVRPDGKWNRHQTKNEDEIIRIEGGIPQIISKEDFQKVQTKMTERKHKTATFKAKQEYLLSGKIKCGVCGSSYAGNSRKATKKNPLYVSYNCTKKNGKTTCKNPGIKRDDIEKEILHILADKIFDEKVIPEIVAKYNDYAKSRNVEYTILASELKGKISEVSKKIDNIVNVVASTGSAALINKLKELEEEKMQLENSLKDNDGKISKLTVDEKTLRTAFQKAKQMLRSGTSKNKKAIVEKYIKEIVVYKDKIEIEYAISDTYSLKEIILRNIKY